MGARLSEKTRKILGDRKQSVELARAIKDKKEGKDTLIKIDGDEYKLVRVASLKR